MMMDLAPPRGHTIKQSPVRKRPAKSVRARTAYALFASQSLDNKPTAGKRSWRLDVFGYSIHGLALLFLSLWALSHFGQVFWFFSVVSAALGVFRRAKLALTHF